MVSFSTKSDSRSPISAAKPKSKLILSGKNSLIQNPISVISKGSQIVVLDQNFGLQAFELSHSSPELLWSYKVDDVLFNNIKDLTHLSYNSDKKMLFIFDSKGSYSKLTY